MGISKVTLNGVTQMDISSTTAMAPDTLEGKTFFGADGEEVTGTIPTKTSSNLTASGATVTAPAGYYATAATKTIASGSASIPSTAITVTPTITVSNTGLITATASGSKSVTPSVTAGYISSGTAGTLTVSGSNTSQLTTKAAATITPTTTDQTIAAGTYLTGAQTIKGDSNLIRQNIKQGVRIFGVYGSLEIPSFYPYWDNYGPGVFFFSYYPFSIRMSLGQARWVAESNSDGCLYYATGETLSTWEWDIWDGTGSIEAQPFEGASGPSGMVWYIIGLYGHSLSTWNPNNNKDYNNAILVDGVGVSVHGNLMHLLDYNDAYYNLPANCFSYLFAGCNAVFDVVLQPDSIGNYACNWMFAGSSIVKPPALPCESLGVGSYSYMFYNCKWLEQFNQLPAATIPNYCYQSMYGNCPKVKVYANGDGDHWYNFYIPAYGHLGNPGTSSTLNMFSGTGGTFTGTPQITVDGAEYMYFTYEDGIRDPWD